MAVRQQQRRGTASQWATANPVLAAGEIGFEVDTNKFKIGDGTNRWDDLTYFTADAAAAIQDIIDGAPDLLNTLNELAASLGDNPDFVGTVTSDLAAKAPLANPTFTGTVSGITKGMVGLGNVDNTSDADKPISTATQTALNLKANSADITELSQDAVNSALTAGTGITKTYNDSANTITVAVDSTIATKTYADGKASDAQSAAESFATSADSTLHTTITSEIATAKSEAISTAEGYTDTAITNLVNGAPSVLDTLKELSDALGADKNFSTTVATNIASAKTDAEGYTDSAISTEVSNRNSAIATAKSQAISTAEGYTDSAISSEVSSRTSAIATAKSEAISTAASDATTKANSAKSGAEATAAAALSSHEADTTNIHGITDTAELATKAFAASLLTGATKTNITISGDKNGLTITAENGVADSTTDDLTEGTSHQYFTSARAITAIETAMNNKTLSAVIDGGGV